VIYFQLTGEVSRKEKDSRHQQNHMDYGQVRTTYKGQISSNRKPMLFLNTRVFNYRTHKVWVGMAWNSSV